MNSEGPDKDSLSHALDVLRHGRQTHIEWIDYLENENPDFNTEQVGDVAHHRWYLTGYDPAIALLELWLVRIEGEAAHEKAGSPVPPDAGKGCLK